MYKVGINKINTFKKQITYRVHEGCPQPQLPEDVKTGALPFSPESIEKAKELCSETLGFVEQTLTVTPLKKCLGIGNTNW